MSSSVPRGVRVAREWAWSLLLIGVGVYVLTLVVAKFADIVIAVLVALLLSALLRPVVRRIPDRVPRGLATLAVVLATILVIAGIFTLVGRLAADQFPELRRSAASGAQDVLNWLSTGPLHISHDSLSSSVDRVQRWASDNQSTLLSGAVGVTSSLTHVVEGAFITLFSTFFFLSSGQRIWAWVLRILPQAAREPLDAAARSGWVTLSHYVRATFIVAIVDGVGIGLGAVVLGVPLAVPLGVVVFFGAFIPIVGALVTGILAVLVALVAKGLTTAIILIGVVILVNQLEAHVLQPFLLGRAVEVHPLAVILSLAAGSAVAGIVGALFAVPFVAVANTVVTSLASHGRRDPAAKDRRPDAPLAPDQPPPTDAEPAEDVADSAVPDGHRPRSGSSAPEPTPS